MLLLETMMRPRDRMRNYQQHETKRRSRVWAQKCKHTFGDKHLFLLQTVNEISLSHKMNVQNITRIMQQARIDVH